MAKIVVDEKKSIGFFGGSFDPIHNGHLHLALSLMEVCQLDQVLICPTYSSPFKKDRPCHASALLREQMVRSAIEAIPQFLFIDYELYKKSPCYTIDTIEYLYSQYALHKQEVSLHVMLGEDHLRRFHEWRSIEKILAIAPPLVGARPEALQSIEAPSLLQEKIYKIPNVDISSTQIRERLKQGLYCGHLVPQGVLEIIYQNQLYQ